MGKHSHIVFEDRTRQAALLETMVLAAMADGKVSRIEVEEIFRRVHERPEFNGIQVDELKLAIAHAADEVARANALENILPTLAARIADRPSRRLAFGLAAAVATSEHKHDPREIKLLKRLQDAFELPDSEVADLFERAEFKAPMPPTRATGTEAD